MKVGDLVNVTDLGVQPVTAITESGLVRIGNRLYHDSGIEMKHEPGQRTRFSKILDSEIERRKNDG